jgi:hypothetical protein
MNHFSRREFLKFGTALPLALQSLDLRAATAPSTKVPPKRIIFICNSLGFYKPNFFPTKRGDFSTSPYLKEMATREKMTVFQNLFHPGMETSNHDSEKSFLTGASSPEAANFVNTISLDQILAREMGGGRHPLPVPFVQHLRPWLGVFVEQPGRGDSADAR